MIIPVDKETIKYLLETVGMLVNVVQQLARKDELTPEQEAALIGSGDTASRMLHELLQEP